VRLELKVVPQNDGDFVDAVLLYFAQNYEEQILNKN
jgi:hypothetical protein